MKLLHFFLKDLFTQITVLVEEVGHRLDQKRLLDSTRHAVCVCHVQLVHIIVSGIVMRSKSEQPSIHGRIYGLFPGSNFPK